jgi:predicted dehydrogenase
VGVVGCGVISEKYLENMLRFKNLEVIACADILPARAQERAKQFGLPHAYTVAELLADPAIGIVVNLTIPRAHGEIGLAAVEAGKSLYNEKPLTLDRVEAQQILERARERGLLVGAAPDTFLGGGLQTCRALIDSGAIGEPVAATAFMLSHGPEGWHPDPDFFYQPGGGPLFDMAPYYLTALVTLLGPVRRVSGSARITFAERTITSKKLAGTKITVRTPTHVAGLLDFAAGPIATIVTSFDVWASEAPRLEIYGTEGSLSLPDPNTFHGPVRIRRPGDDEWTDVALTHGFTENSRGLGVADMAAALQTGRPHRANGALAYHVLDIMHAIIDASTAGRHIDMESTCERPDPLPATQDELPW